MKTIAFIFVFVTASLVPAVGKAVIQLPSLIGDNMVLQRSEKIRIWGTADPGEKITVNFCGQRQATTVGADRIWHTELAPVAAGGPYEMTITGQTTLRLTNILVGDVWVAAGQSNMQFAVCQLPDAARQIAQSRVAGLRFFTVPPRLALQPVTEIPGQWVESNPQNSPWFSAVAYFFARKLNADLNVPVGIIHASWGGTLAESWMSLSALQKDSEFAPILIRQQQEVARYTKLKEESDKALVKWNTAAEEAKRQRKPEPTSPVSPVDPAQNPQAPAPAALFNAMIAPLTPYTIRGAIWYQGEGNASRGYQYRKLLPALIQDWRKAWRQGDFPFLIVQLPNYGAVCSEPGESTWAELREAQAMALALPRTGLAVTIDLGEANDIHPKNKQDIGKRLALTAEAIAYGKKVVYSGPVYQSMRQEGEKVRLQFRHVDGGLLARGRPELQGFAIAGADKKFVGAQAKIEGNTVVVWSKQVTHPSAVRYAWADNPVCNLYNQACLPASSFRTDDWPGASINSR
ncbi:MAG: sialate O-acetylesterase [Phycisphaerae bacterium]